MPNYTFGIPKNQLKFMSHITYFMGELTVLWPSESLTVNADCN